MRSHCNELRRARPLLGTFVEIVLPEPAHDPAAAILAAFAEIEEVQRRMSFHDPQSALSEINREAARGAVPADPWTFEVLQMAAEMHRISSGIFDVTRVRGSSPAVGSCAAEGGSFASVELSADRAVRFHDSHIQIDLGGIAKGYAVDRAVAVLSGCGFPCGLVNAGGDLRAFGERSFPLSIRHPDAPGIVLVQARVREAAVATSAHYFLHRQPGHGNIASIRNPRLSEHRPLPRSVTVRARTAMLADALTKVVMLQAKDALPVLRHFGADAFFVSTAGETMCSEGWHATQQLSS